MDDTLVGEVETPSLPVHEPLKGEIAKAQTLHGVLSASLSLVAPPDYMLATDEDIDNLFLEED